MKRLIIALAILAVCSCTKSEYKATLETPGTDRLSTLTLSPNAEVLFADGQSEIRFTVKGFMDVEYTRVVDYIIDGEHVVEERTVEETVAVADDRLPIDKLVITASTGETLGSDMRYSTTSGAGTTVSFTCKLGDLESAPVEVAILPVPQDDWEVVTIPVVFHLMTNESSKSLHDGITSKMLGETIDRVNKVFAGTFDRSPYSVDTKIRFELAAQAPDGTAMKEPGINRVDMQGKSNSQIYDAADRHLWNINDYLNIVLSDTGFYEEWPVFIHYMGLDVLWDLLIDDYFLLFDMDEEIYWPSVEMKAIFLENREFYRLLNRETLYTGNSFEKILGHFFGLRATSGMGGGPMNDSDYCGDTYMWTRPDFQKGNFSWTKQKLAMRGSPAPVYFDSINIMDDASASWAISYDQALRLRAAVDYIAGRNIRKKY